MIEMDACLFEIEMVCIQQRKIQEFICTSSEFYFIISYIFRFPDLVAPAKNTNMAKERTWNRTAARFFYVNGSQLRNTHIWS